MRLPALGLPGPAALLAPLAFPLAFLALAGLALLRTLARQPLRRLRPGTTLVLVAFLAVSMAALVRGAVSSDNLQSAAAGDALRLWLPAWAGTVAAFLHRRAARDEHALWLGVCLAPILY